VPAHPAFAIEGSEERHLMKLFLIIVGAIVAAALLISIL
jgi:hypothetical protein